MRSREEALRILENALKLASTGGLEVEAAMGGGILGVTRFAENEVHQATQVDREILALRVAVNGKVGRVETGDCSTAGIQLEAKRAKLLADLLPAKGEAFGLPDAQTYWPVEGYDPETERATALDRMAIAGRAIVAAHKRDLTATGYVATGFGALDPGHKGRGGVYAVANTRGLVAYHAGTRATMSLTMTRADGATGWAEASAYALREIDVDALIDAASRKASPKGTLKLLPPGSFTVVLEPAAVAALVAQLGETVGAEDMHAGKSFLSGNLGKRVTGANVTISDDHAHPAHRATPFDGQGVARKKVVLLENGVARSPVYGWASAKRYNAEPTGHFEYSDLDGEVERASSLVMSGGSATLGDLIGGTKSGVLVSRLWYTHLVDPRTLSVTGMTRDGTFLIQNGEVVAPLANMRFNVSVLELFSKIDALTAPVWASEVVAPAVRAHGFRFTSSVTG